MQSQQPNAAKSLQKGATPYIPSPALQSNAILQNPPDDTNTPHFNYQKGPVFCHSFVQEASTLSK